MAILEAQERQEKKKNKVKKLRSEGYIPCVLYGLNKEPVSISVKRSELLKTYKSDFGINTIIEMTIKNGNKPSNQRVLTHSIETDSVTNSIKHIDFIRVDDNIKIKAHIPIKLTGTAPGLKMGGVLVQKTDALHVKCLPAHLLKSIEVDLSKQEIGDFIRIKDLKLENIETLTNAEDTIVRIASPRTQVEEETTAEGEEGEAAAEGEEGSTVDGESTSTETATKDKEEGSKQGNDS